jgi:glutaredoxin
VATIFGVLRPDGRSERAVFVIDKDGFIRYADIHDINEAPSNVVLRRVIREIDPSVRDRPEEIVETKEPLPHGGVVMYCTPWCPDCREARKWLTARKIPFTEVDISTNLKAARHVEMWANGQRTTPTFDIDGTIIVDYDVAKLEKALKV